MAVSTAPSSMQGNLPVNIDEGDQIIYTRITNDDRPLRRVIKKFHNYTSLSHNPVVPSLLNAGGTASSVDAREAFLVELASFQLSLKKSKMICEAEARQVEEYQRERNRIDKEHEILRGQIEELKVALEHAQVLRRRKIEYDLVAEKVNTLPSREDLEQSIEALENDMAAIRAEHNTQNRMIQGQKSALDGIIVDLGSLRFMGKEVDANTSAAPSQRVTPAPEDHAANETDMDGEGNEGSLKSSTQPEDQENGELDKMAVRMTSEIPTSEGALEDDIEMGEVEEDPKDKGKKKIREDLEEGEASDASSELSAPPDD